MICIPYTWMLFDGIKLNVSIFFCLVTKPTSKSFEPPPRPSNPAPSRSAVPPPRPSNPPQRPAPPHQNVDVESNSETDVGKPEIDLLNMIPQSNSGSNIPPKEPSFDLLGGFESNEAQGNNAMPDLLSDSQTKSHGLDDIFGSIGQTNNASNANLPDLSNIGLSFNATNASVSASSNNLNFDPFGNASAFVSNAELLRPTSNETSPSQAKQPPSSAAQANKDPFADMANLASGLNLNWGAQSTASKPTTAGTSPISTQYSSPTHQFGGFVPNANANPSSVHQARSPMDNQPKADYSRSHFETKAKQNGANATANATANAVPPSSSGVGDIFADILGQQGYNFATKPQAGPRTNNAM